VILQDDVLLRVYNHLYTRSMKFDRRSSSTYCYYRELAHCHVGRYMDPWELVRACSSEVCMLSTVFLHRRNRGLPAISSSRGTGNFSALKQSEDGATAPVKSRRGQRKLGPRRVLPPAKPTAKERV